MSTKDRPTDPTSWSEKATPTLASRVQDVVQAEWARLLATLEQRPTTEAQAIEPDDLMDTEDLANALGYKVSSLRSMRTNAARHRSLDCLPDPLRTISGRPVWRAADIREWLTRRPK